jgi:translation initiation factor 6 (eIF-6)
MDDQILIHVECHVRVLILEIVNTDFVLVLIPNDAEFVQRIQNELEVGLVNGSIRAHVSSVTHGNRRTILVSRKS